MSRSLFKIFKYIFVVILITVILFFVLVIFPFSKIGFPEKDYTHLVIDNVNIVDIKNDTIYQNQFLTIEGNHIKKISALSIDTNKEKLKRIDGSGKYLIPALWDMHVHLSKQSPISAYAEFIVNGVMHVRDMRGAYNDRDHFASTPERIRNWNQKVKGLELLGPTVHNATSFALEGPSAMFDKSPDFFNCSNPEEAKELVSFFKDQEIDLIKIYNNIPVDAFFTLMKEAKLAGITVAGHKPVRVSTIEAANAGMRSMEHARFLIWDSFAGSQELRKDKNPKSRDHTKLRRQMLAEHDSLLLSANLRALKSNQTWYCPTHLTRKSDAFADDIHFRAKYDHINPIFRFLSFEDLDATINEDSTALGRKTYRDFYAKALDITKTANESGVKILAGSDVPELPGSSLIDELQELSNAGLTNYEVLKTATLHPAEYYALDHEFGTIEVGKKADLILLSQNPIADISSLRNVNGIIYKGNYLDADEISRLRQKINSRNKSLLLSAKLIWSILLYMTI